MGDGSHVLNHNDFQTCGLQSPDGGLTSLAGALDVDLNGLQAVLLSSVGSGLGCGLSCEGSGLTGTTEAQTAGEMPR